MPPNTDLSPVLLDERAKLMVYLVNTQQFSRTDVAKMFKVSRQLVQQIVEAHRHLKVELDVKIKSNS